MNSYLNTGPNVATANFLQIFLLPRSSRNVKLLLLALCDKIQNRVNLFAYLFITTLPKVGVQT